MNLGTWEMWQWAWQNFTEESFVHCLSDARYGDFSKGSWHYWHIRLSMSPIPPVSGHLGNVAMGMAEFYGRILCPLFIRC